MITRRIVFMLVFGTLGAFQLYGQAFDKYKLAPGEVPKGYTPVQEMFYKSTQPRTFYEKPDLYESLLGKIKQKDYQSFTSKHDKGTILYFEFDAKPGADAFLSGLLWGGEKPSREHPEEFWLEGNVLIIWCFQKKSILKQVSVAKVTNTP